MKGRNSLLWVLSVFLLLCALGVTPTSVVTGVLLMLYSIVFNPLFQKQLKKIVQKSKRIIVVPMLFALVAMSACSTSDSSSSNTAEQVKNVEVSDTTNTTEQPASTEQETTKATPTDTTSEPQPTSEEPVATEATNAKTISTMDYNGVTYTIVEVDGGDKSGSRQANVAVDVGYGDRVYWAYTNEYGQLVNVTADQISIQDDTTEPVNSDGRYYDDEANVPGTEQDDLDQGHVIADSLGGVSNAYNITPENSTLNRNGDQAYMEKVIRDAGCCENFVATITYADTTTQIPSHYHFEYDLKGNHVVDDFDNVNPDEVNAKANTQSNGSDSSSNTASVAAVAGAAAGSSSTTQDTAAVQQTEEVADNTDTTSIEVHITDTGKKYHNAGCRYLKKSDKVTTLDNAKALGLEPCSVCNPPQ